MDVLKINDDDDDDGTNVFDPESGFKLGSFRVNLLKSESYNVVFGLKCNSVHPNSGLLVY